MNVAGMQKQARCYGNKFTQVLFSGNMNTGNRSVKV